MKIAILSNHDPRDLRNWSGTTSHIVKALEKEHEVVWLGGNLVQAAYWHHRYTCENKKFYPENYTSFFAKILSEEISAGRFDLVIIRDYYYGIGLQIEVPTLYITDATFDQFKHYLNVTDNYYSQLAEKTEEALLEQTDIIISASEWTKRNIVDHYSANPNKCHVIEFGANIPYPADYVQRPALDECRLLFIGTNWEKKGGSKVLETYRLIKKKGVHCKLTIIGSQPDGETDDGVMVIPHLNKEDPHQLLRLCEELKNAHFLVLPTQFDGFGIVFCEASAYGVPSLATNVGGVSQPIRNGRNGYLFDEKAAASEYADKILHLFSHPDEYYALRASSRKEFESRLNWDVWTDKIIHIIQEYLDNYRKHQEEHDEQYYLPVYAINLKSRGDRREHIIRQFEGRDEFMLNIVEAEEHQDGRIGLWNSMVKIARQAIADNEDFVIICEDDHEFTSAYSKEYLFSNIARADEQGAELLSGGIGGYGQAVAVDSNRYWIDWFWCTQFIVVFRPLLKKMVEYDFQRGDTADGVLSKLTINKITMFPFISVQRDFGYSDVTLSNDRFKGLISTHFIETGKRLSIIHAVRKHYHQMAFL